MNLVISHVSALRFWRTFSGDIARLQRPRTPSPMNAPVPLTPELKAELAALGFTPSPQKPLDLLFASDAVRSRAKSFRAHSVSRQLPSGSLVRLSKHVLVASPELAFIQASTRHSFGQLIMAGAEMCGAYALISATGAPLAKPRERIALTSAEHILNCALALGYAPTSSIARAAAAIPNNTESPMEARVAALLCASHVHGGYGLPAPSLNWPVELSDAALALYPHSPCRCDLFWPEAQLDLEYDGSDHENRLTEDSARRAALNMEGIDVVAVTKAQVFDASAFDAIVQVLCKKLGLPFRNRTDPLRFAQANGVLRRELGLV